MTALRQMHSWKRHCKSIVIKQLGLSHGNNVTLNDGRRAHTLIAQRFVLQRGSARTLWRLSWTVGGMFSSLYKRRNGGSQKHSAQITWLPRASLLNHTSSRLRLNCLYNRKWGQMQKLQNSKPPQGFPNDKVLLLSHIKQANGWTGSSRRSWTIK